MQCFTLLRETCSGKVGDGAERLRRKMKELLVLVLSLLIVYQNGHCSPAKKLSIDQYLNRYGYMAAYDGPPPLDKKRKAIELFQGYARIPVTGKMDKATTAMLTGPRCGESDRDLRVSRLKRYVKHDTKWKKLELSYSVHGTPQPRAKILYATVRATLEKSFRMWKDVSKLSFRRLRDNDNNADIIIKFGVGSHGDLYPFDGKGGTLAHAFYPGSNTGIAGDIHFDDDEIWTINGEQGTTDYTWTALHEIGHAIGLRHSYEQDAIMWPWFTGYKANTQLTRDDINGIQDIYGKPSTSVTKPKSSVCNVQSFDAIFYHSSTRNTYFFKGKFVWEMNEKKRITKQELIATKWPGLESDLDSAYSRPTDRDIIFFKGNRFWRYRGNRRIDGPSDLSRYITNHRRSLLRYVGAAMVWKSTGQTYFFTDNMYWRYNELKRIVETSGYPRVSASVWNNIPFPVNDVFTWKNGKTFFFVDGKVYLYRYNKKIRYFEGKQGKKHFIADCRK